MGLAREYSMSNPFSKYVAYVFSIADYEDGVGYSSVSEDFPVVLGPATLFDTWYRVSGLSGATQRRVSRLSSPA